jgi:hypothetical protein
MAHGRLLLQTIANDSFSPSRRASLRTEASLDSSLSRDKVLRLRTEGLQGQTMLVLVSAQPEVPKGTRSLHSSKSTRFERAFALRPLSVDFVCASQGSGRRSKP